MKPLTTDKKTDFMKYLSLLIVVFLIVLQMFDIEVDRSYIDMIIFLIIGANSHYIGKT